jgi:hypothetical protein
MDGPRESGIDRNNHIEPSACTFDPALLAAVFFYNLMGGVL